MTATLDTFRFGNFYSLPKLQAAGFPRIARLPVSLRIVLESLLRNLDGKRVRDEDLKNLASWEPTAERVAEVPFVVSRVLLQDFTGVPLLVDLAAMRSAAARLGKDPGKIEPLVPVDMVIDHSVAVDNYGTSQSLTRNIDVEFTRNQQRYEFLKWGTQAFKTFRIVPPSVGIVHQVNLEFLAQSVMQKDGVFYPDTLVGTDSHTTMINGLGVVGFGVGGIEAEAAMLGQPVYFLMPDVVGVHLHGSLKAGVTATDLVLTVTELLRKAKVVGKFVEFFGQGVEQLALTDRATVANMCPEYGATVGFFPIDQKTCDYLLATGRPKEHVEMIAAYYQAQGMFGVPKMGEVDYSQVVDLDLATVVPSVAGPKRPQDRIALPDLPAKFASALHTALPAGFGRSEEDAKKVHKVTIHVDRDAWRVSAPAVDVDEVFQKFKLGVAEKTDVKDSGVHYDLAVAYEQMMLLDDAITEFQAAGKDPTRLALCQSMIGSIYEKKGKLDDAIAAYEKGLEAEHLSRAECLGLLFQLATLAERKKDIRGAVGYYRGVLSIDANYRMGEARSRLNDLERTAEGAGLSAVGNWSERVTAKGAPDRNDAKDGLVVSTPVDITVQDGDIVVAAITSCTNTSNPALMIAAGLVAKKANERGLKVNPRVKTSLAPGSRVASEYLEKSGLQRHLDALGFNVVGYGCTTCIGNSGPLAPELEDVITKNKIVTASVLSGNRNFEARIHAAVYANFLASPPLVVAYALAGRVTIDIDKDPVGHDTNGAPVFLRDIWPSANEVNELLATATSPESYQRLYGALDMPSPKWFEIQSKTGLVFEWDPASTYVREPPYFEHFGHAPSDHTLKDIVGARALAIFGDSITTDHISPAGAIKASSPAGMYLEAHGVQKADFNSYGSRRGNHEVMVRGTFANVRIKNLMVPGVEGGVTTMQPSGETLSIFEAAEKYAASGTKLFVFAGQEYGTGSSRDWAAKGPRLQTVSAVFARSFERIHRSNLVGMGVLPCQLPADVSAETLKLTGKETFDLVGIGHGVHPRMPATLRVHREDGSQQDVPVTVRIDTPIEVEYFKHGGILPFVLQQLMAS